MTWMQAVVIVLYSASALLPLAGLFGLYRTARERLVRLSRGKDPKTFSRDDWMENDFRDVLSEGIIHGPERILSDFVLIGGGVVCGAVAGIWTLFPLS
ncbi:hypothetical protein [Microbacterium maritypicum]|uniref:hypothetical protein n=1 Tax=Microbacterium maritypicum TaxID=33918 RepID=UPI003D70B0FC